MAVAADSHRDFLILGQYRRGYARERMQMHSDVMRLFLFRNYITEKRVLQAQTKKRQRKLCPFPSSPTIQHPISAFAFS